jgi:hypothetical protein
MCVIILVCYTLYCLQSANPRQTEHSYDNRHNRRNYGQHFV